MKIKHITLSIVICWLANPIYAKSYFTTQKSIPSMQNSPTSVTTSNLLQILQSDDIYNLKKFIKEHPQFNWNKAYLNLPWSSETQTPLHAATWLGSVEIVRYLLNKNKGHIRNTINTKNSFGFTPLQIAQIPPANPERNLELYPNQTDPNYERISKILEKYHSKTKNKLKRKKS